MRWVYVVHKVVVTESISIFSFIFRYYFIVIHWKFHQIFLNFSIFFFHFCLTQLRFFLQASALLSSPQNHRLENIKIAKTNIRVPPSPLPRTAHSTPISETNDKVQYHQPTRHIHSRFNLNNRNVKESMPCHVHVMQYNKSLLSTQSALF